MNKNDIMYCRRCRHSWRKRNSVEPKYCPKCKSPYWRRPRKHSPLPLITDLVSMAVILHESIIKLSGGLEGIRDRGGIEFSVHALVKYMENNAGSPTKLGAFILNEFAKKHHFNDGNKRTAYGLAKTFMLINRCHLKVDFKEATQFILEVAKYGSIVTLEQIKDWLDDNCTIIDEEEIKSYLNETYVNLMLRRVELHE